MSLYDVQKYIKPIDFTDPQSLVAEYADEGSQNGRTLTYTSRGIIPPSIFAKLEEHYRKNDESEHANFYLKHKQLAHRQHQQAALIANQSDQHSLLGLSTAQTSVYLTRNENILPGTLARNNSTPSKDRTYGSNVNKVYDLTVGIRGALNADYQRNGIDNKGMKDVASVVQTPFANCFWNGRQMVYGAGDPNEHIGNFIDCPDVAGHQEGHGITQYNAGIALPQNRGRGSDLDYEKEAGGLNEGYSDMFGIVYKQNHTQSSGKPQVANQNANWLIGEGLILDGKNNLPLRNMLNPGTAFKNVKVIGSDDQVATYQDYMQRAKTEDVDPHTSSGIFNRAFALSCINLTGNSSGVRRQDFSNYLAKVYYIAQQTLLPNASFKDAALAVHNQIVKTYGANSEEDKAVRNGWAAVGVTY